MSEQKPCTCAGDCLCKRVAELERRLAVLQRFFWLREKDARDKLSQWSMNQDHLLGEMADAGLSDHLPTFQELRNSVHANCVPIDEPCPCACGACGNRIGCRCLSPVCTDCTIEICKGRSNDDGSDCAYPAEVTGG